MKNKIESILLLFIISTILLTVVATIMAADVIQQIQTYAFYQRQLQGIVIMFAIFTFPPQIICAFYLFMKTFKAQFKEKSQNQDLIEE